jgi:plasmid stabilization system protein ParE
VRLARLSPRALRTFRDEVRYIAQRNPAAARRLRDRMDAARRLLAEHPEAGAPTETPGVRRFVITEFGYVLTYSRTKTGVEIASMRHGRQSPS